MENASIKLEFINWTKVISSGETKMIVDYGVFPWQSHENIFNDYENPTNKRNNGNFLKGAMTKIIDN